MKLISSLPFNRQAKPVRQQLLADLRDLIRTHKLTFDLPRIRLRSLDVIPLSLSLPRYTSITKITAKLHPLATANSWLSLSSITSLASPLTTPLLSSLRSFYSTTSSSPSLSKLPPLLTWNPSSLKTIHQTPSRKMNHILKLSHKHICFLQETQWSSVQYNHLLLQSPFCTITHAPAINTSSSGVAILLPKTLTPSSSLIIAPGYILSLSLLIGGIIVELINVYLHPDHVGTLAKTLLKHLRTDASRTHPFRIIGGDFNQLHSKPIFQDILMELDSPPPPLMPTFRKSNGYTSPLDFFLFQLPPSIYSMTTPKFTTFWPEYQPTGHGMHICKFPRVTSVTSQADDTPVSTIPTSVFYSPPSQLHSSISLSSSSDLASLSRSLKQLTSPSILKAKATIWNWWRSKKHSPHLSPASKHLHLLLRLLRSPPAPLVQVPSASWEWLLSHFLLTKLPLSQSCMTDSSLFPSIFSPNFVINIKLSTPKTHARLVSLNSLPPHPLLGKNVALPPPRSQNIQGLYALHQVTFVLPPPNLILLSGPLVPFGPIFPPPSPLTGPLFYISMLMLHLPFLLVQPLPLKTFFTPLLLPLTPPLVPTVSPTLLGEFVPPLPPFA